MLNGETLTDGLFNINPSGIRVVCPVLDILRKEAEEIMVELWCIKCLGFWSILI